jgi:hypothetical protein
MREFFGLSEVGETYQEFANVIESELKDRFQAPLETIRLRRQNTRLRNYPYPGEREITTLSMGVQKLLQIRDPEQTVKEFIQAEVDMDVWFGGLKTYWLHKNTD